MQYLLLVLFANTLAGQWVDPHDMDMKYPKDLSQQTNQLGEKSISKCICSQPVVEDMAFVYLKRVISLLLSSASSDDENISLLKGKYFFDKDGEDYTFLLKFTSSKENNLEDLRHLDTILNAAFNKKFSDSILNILVTTNNFFSQLLNVKTITFVAACITLFIFYYLLKTNFTFWYILRYFIFIIWIIDFAFRYQYLLEVNDVLRCGIIYFKFNFLGS